MLRQARRSDNGEGSPAADGSLLAGDTEGFKTPEPTTLLIPALKEQHKERKGPNTSVVNF